MAKLIQALHAYGPRVKFNDTVQLEQVAHWISSRTTLNSGEVAMVLREFRDCVLFFNNYGAPVKLPGLGRFAPSIGRDGRYRIKVTIDSSLRDGINQPHAFTGSVTNRQHIGLDNAAFKVMWDAEHPDDPLEI